MNYEKFPLDLDMKSLELWGQKLKYEFDLSNLTATYDSC